MSHGTVSTRLSMAAGAAQAAIGKIVHKPDTQAKGEERKRRAQEARSLHVLEKQADAAQKNDSGFKASSPKETHDSHKPAVPPKDAKRFGSISSSSSNGSRASKKEKAKKTKKTNSPKLESKTAENKKAETDSINNKFDKFDFAKKKRGTEPVGIKPLESHPTKPAHSEPVRATLRPESPKSEPVNALPLTQSPKPAALSGNPLVDSPTPAALSGIPPVDSPKTALSDHPSPKSEPLGSTLRPESEQPREVTPLPTTGVTAPSPSLASATSASNYGGSSADDRASLSSASPVRDSEYLSLTDISLTSGAPTTPGPGFPGDFFKPSEYETSKSASRPDRPTVATDLSNRRAPSPSPAGGSDSVVRDLSPTTPIADVEDPKFANLSEPGAKTTLPMTPSRVSLESEQPIEPVPSMASGVSNAQPKANEPNFKDIFDKIAEQREAEQCSTQEPSGPLSSMPRMII